MENKVREMIFDLSPRLSLGVMHRDPGRPMDSTLLELARQNVKVREVQDDPCLYLISIDECKL